MTPTTFTIECHGPGSLYVKVRDGRGHQQGVPTFLGPKEKARVEMIGNDGVIEIEELPPQ